MNRCYWPRALKIAVVLALLLVVGVQARPTHPPGAQARLAQPTRLSPFGMNMYFTNPVRPMDHVNSLSLLAQSIGVRWSREEISWATYATVWGQGEFDMRIGKLANDGYGIIGMLLTTPEAFSTQACKSWANAHGRLTYWCPPANPADFAAYAAEVVERYDGDGYLDAPGSPRVAYWEVWNEPDQDEVWLPQADPVAYTALLKAAYTAIKQADPTAQVLVGGMTDWDTVGKDGFMDVVVAHGGWDYFDILSFHPYLMEYPPEQPNQPWNIPARARMVQNWLQAHGGGKQAWATEFGWSTCTLGGNCLPGQNRTEEEQANFMVREHVILLGGGFAHLDYFQLEDKVNGAQTPFSECAIIRDDFTPKPAFTAYGVMTDRLQDARYAGHGPLHNVQEQWSDRHDYSFVQIPAGNSGVWTWTDVLWQLEGQATVQFPIGPRVEHVYLYDRDGNPQALTPVGGYVSVTLSERPRYLVRTYTAPVWWVFLPLALK